MNINKIVALLGEIYQFLSSHKVSFATVISHILKEIASAQTDREKLLVIESAKKELQGGMGSLNDVWICKENGNITNNEQGDNQKLEEYRVRLQGMLAR